MGDKTLEMTLLFDFYGELLTDKQREYFDLYHNEDMSLSEISSGAGITRQGARDMIVRAEASLIEIENKLGLVRRFTEMRGLIEEAEALAAELEKNSTGASAAAAARLGEILGELKG